MTSRLKALIVTAIIVVSMIAFAIGCLFNLSLTVGVVLGFVMTSLFIRVTYGLYCSLFEHFEYRIGEIRKSNDKIK